MMDVLRGFAVGITVCGWLIAACWIAGVVSVGGVALGLLLMGNAIMAAFTLTGRGT